jgi:hypothetical protein
MYIKYINETLTWKFERILLSLKKLINNSGAKHEEKS